MVVHSPSLFSKENRLQMDQILKLAYVLKKTKKKKKTFRPSILYNGDKWNSLCGYCILTAGLDGCQNIDWMQPLFN
ncbi:hypothetical protein AB205_0128550 [Aquarana catesbeiana]|uniref:Uncharacterized protein n=1 Tax=Aquarana catesbeiana TaxID=8400 RepID=A0A2G9SDF1_AQUCT|nr:hypothetical protein AB205_0128550 [Aquarana catesbeiana]